MDMRNLRGKVALVTGAGSGIGQAVAIRLAEEGADVVVASRNSAHVDDTCERVEHISGSAPPLRIRLDVTDRAGVEAAVAEVVAHYGGLDIVSNNAGIDLVHLPSVAETTEEEWSSILDVNVTGIFRVCRAVIPHLRAEASVINMASMFSLVAAPNEGPYAASKGALLQFSRAMALELAPRGIRVNCVCPGIIDTPMTDSFLDRETEPERVRAEWAAFSPMNRLGTATEVADCVVFLASPWSSFVTGAALVVDGGATVQ
jgi:NAD(P)-dependent dehydrogenase (short-subunit alcohol dehydrogenase family)